MNNEAILFITGNGYLDQQNKERWEFLADSQKRLGYSIPDAETVNQHDYALLPDGIYSSPGLHSGSEKFRSYIMDDIPELYQAISDALVQYQDRNIECIITWCNCETLRHYCNANGIPLIHMELGPLRNPEYISTAYFDFSGVNGHTEAQTRYENWLKQEESQHLDISIPSLRKFFTQQPYARKPEQYPIGAALQVEDDSNIIAYSCGNNNQDVINHTYNLLDKNGTQGNCIFRGHPGSRFIPNDKKILVDHSKSSRTFISSCKEILAINSSVIFEAMLQGKKTYLLGDSPFKFICKSEPSDESFSKAVFFFLFGYLVPFNKLFDTEYIRFRLSGPSDKAVIERNFEYYDTNIENRYQAKVQHGYHNFDALIKCLREHTEANFDIDYTDTETDVVSEQEVKLRELLKKSEDIESELLQLQKLYQDKDQELAYAISVVEARDATIQQLNDALRQEGAAHGYAISVVEVRDAEIITLKEKITAQEQEAQKLHEEIDIRGQQLDAMRAELLEKDAFIKRLESTFLGSLLKRYITYLRK